MPSNTFNGSCVFTTSYSYGSDDKEYVFSCKGRPFVALVSPNLPTPNSSLVDYDLVRKLGLTMADIQCRKFYFGGHKMRILGRVSTAVQCVQNGRLNGNFHVKGLVIADLYQMLETHCVAGARMQERLAHLAVHAEADSGEESDEEQLNTSLDGYNSRSSPPTTATLRFSPPTTAAMKFSPSTATMSKSSSPTTAVSKSSPSTTAAMKSSPLTTAALESSPSITAALESSPSITSAMESSPTRSTRSPSTAAMSSPNMVLSPTSRESNRINAVRLKKDWEKRKDSLEIYGNKQVWARLKRRDPETAWEHLKYVAGVEDWPWHGGLLEPSLDADPHELRGEWLRILEENDPDCLCICGFPHGDYKCRKSNHDKEKKHCKACCDDPKYLRFLM